MTAFGRLAGAAAVVSTAGLVALVAGVGAVATYAELTGTWSGYRQMEVVVAATAEPAVALAVLATVTTFVAIVRAN